MSETIDLTNYPIIAQNQGGSCEITEIVALHGIDLAKTGYSLLLTTLTSISTTVQVVGQNMLGYTGFAVINDEIVQVNSSVAIGDNTSLSISRAMNGTVAQTITSINKDYIFPVKLFFIDTMNYKAKTDLSESDLWGFSLDNGRVILNEDTDEWKIESPSKLYNPYINKRVFLFRGINGQFIKDYEGVTTNYTLRDYGEVEITISDSVATVYNEPLNSNKLFTDMYPKEMMETMFPEYKVQYIADTDETHYPKIKDLTLGEFDKYSDFLQYICKKYALRIIFRKNNTIFIFSDIQQDTIIPTETLTPTNLVSITNNSDGKLVINKAEGSYIQRKDYVNEEDYDNNNKYVKFFYYKDFAGSYTILNADKIWQELSFIMTADELKYITYDDYVLIVLQDGREFICKPSDINVNTSTLKVMCGYDKARYFDYYGRLDNLSAITATNLRLYYAPSSKPVVSKYTRNIGGEDKDSNLQYPIIAGEEEIIYLNYGAVTTNDSTFSGIVKGNIVTNAFIDNTKLLYGKEYAQNLLDCPLYLYSNKIDTSSTDYIKVNSFDNSNIHVKTEWSDDKNQHLKVTFKNTLGGAITSYTPLSVTNNFVKVDFATYNAININATLKLSIVPTSDYTYSTFLNNRNLVWQVVNKTTLSDEYFLVLDMDYPKPVSNAQLSFNVIANATKHSIVEWKSQSILQVSSTDYNNIHTGDCLKLAGMLSTDARYDRYLEYQNVKWLVRSKFTEGADFYIVLDSAYPRKYGYDNFDFIKFDRSNVILINEFYIRGNPVMESTQTYSYNSPESVAFYGTKEYNIDGKCMEKSDFEKVAGYIFNTYTGLDSTNTRMKVNIEIDQRVDIEVGNVFYITDGVITGFNNQKVMVLSKEVSLGDNGLQEQLELLTIGNYETQKITITTNTANNYTPAIAPTYSHLGGEGTTEQTTLQNQNNKIVTLYDDTEGTLTLKEIPIDTFSATTNLSSSIQPTSTTYSLPIDNISASVDYRNTLLRSGADGVILLNNEYMSYKTVGSIIRDSVTIEVTKRALGKSTASIIINGQRVQFYKVIQKVSAEGLTSNEALLGNGVTSYIQVDENKVKIVGEIEITSGQTYDSLIQYTDNTIPNGTIGVGTVSTGTATADGNVIIDFPFSYSQGTWLADSLSIFVKEGGGTITSSDKNFSTSITSTSMRFLLKPNTSYVFGVQANRTVKSGIASTAISSSNTITTVNSNYTGLLQTNDASNYLYQNTTVKMGKNAIATNKDGFYVGNTNINSNPTNYIKFNTTDGTYDMKVTNTVDISNNLNKNRIHFEATDNESFISMNNGQQQIGKVQGLIGKSDFNGIFLGNKDISSKQYFYYDGTDLKFEGKYFNKTAYCYTTEDFIGALDTTKPTLPNSNANVFYNSEVNNIVLMNKDTYIHQDEFVNHNLTSLITVALLSDLPNFFTNNRYYVTATNKTYIQSNFISPFTWREINYSELQYFSSPNFPRDENMTIQFNNSTISGVINYQTYFLIPITERIFSLSLQPLGKVENLTSFGNGVHYGVEPAYNINSTYAINNINIGNYFGYEGYILPNESIKNITSMEGRNNCYIDMNYTGFVIENTLKIENIGLKNIGSEYKYPNVFSGDNYSILLKVHSEIKNINILNIKYPIYSENDLHSLFYDIYILNLNKDLHRLFESLRNIEYINIIINKTFTNLLYLFGDCIDINKIRIIKPKNTIDLNIIISDGYGLFYNCQNLNNIKVWDNFFDCVFRDCLFISDSAITYPEYSFTPTTTQYILNNAQHINDLTILNGEFLVNFTRVMKDCLYVVSCGGITSSQVTNIQKHINNSFD